MVVFLLATSKHISQRTLGIDFTSTVHGDTYPAISPANSNCNNKAVFITGASKGVGRATALAYASAGASHIGLGARSDFSSLEAEINSAASAAGKPKPTVLSVKLDVLDRKSVAQAAEEVEKEFGRLDILINNAGYLEDFIPIIESDEEKWWRTYEVNVRGVYWATKSFLPLLLKGGDKTVVSLSSIGAMNIRPGASSYQSTKLVVLRFSEFLMVEYGEQGLLSYAVHPGGVMTELASKMPANTHHCEPSVLVVSPG
jgi:NAD(P)-dependent dehydrogenase (short-subunit alcohol dehydrogenase family)